MNSAHHLPSRPLVAPEAVVRGEHYRISVLTDGLLRLEYAADGRFEDRASSFALNRELPVPAFRVVDGPSLEIITDRLHLIYDRQPFSTSGLSIQIRGAVSNYHSIWRFGQEPGTLPGTARTLDEADGAIPMESSVVSRHGFGVLDDSASLLFTDDGWVAPRDGSRLDLYFFGYGRDYPAAVRALYAVSGPTPVLPRFALGNWWSRYHRYTSGEYLQLMDRFADEGVPLSVAVLDMDWHLVDIDPALGSGWTGYTWNSDLFPDPPALLAELHRRRLAVTLNVHPADGVRAHEEAYPDMARAMDRDPGTGDPIAFDVTDQRFLAAYFGVLHRRLEDDGVDFWWIDWQSGPFSRIRGIDPLWMLNHFHFLDNAREIDGVERRPLTFSRYAGPGSHRYPVGFSGDTVVSWASLAFQPLFTASASNIGYGWWSHDIGGHMFGIKDDELATRWVQLGVFSPILRLHSSSNRFNTKEPWAFSPAAQRRMVAALRFRHRLLPYLHTMNHRAARDGRPLVQPMYWEHPDVEAAYQVPSQFGFGTELLVAPVNTPVDGETTLGQVRAWLPPGRWTDLFTELSYTGDREVLLHRDLDSIPVLARAGAIIPLSAADSPPNGTENPTALDILIVPGADGAFELIEDDGAGSGLDPATVVRTPISYDERSGAVTIGPAVGNPDVVPARRTWTVTLLGRRTEQVRATIDREAAEASVAPAGRRTQVTVAEVRATAGLTVAFLDPIPVGSEVADRLFILLDRAQIGYELKQRVFEVATAEQPLAGRLSYLLALALPAALATAVTELLLADATD